MGAVFGDRFLLLGFEAPNSPNFFTKNAFNSIRELFFPRESSMSHEKNGCSTKATHGATTEWEQCLEIGLYVLDLWPRILRNFFTKNAFNSIRELFFPREGSMSHEKNGCSTKATHDSTTELEQFLEICFYCLDLWPRILRNFFTKNAFNSIRELFFPSEGSMSHEKNGCSTKATHDSTTEWEQFLEIGFYCLDLWPRIPPLFSQKKHLIRYESYFSHARVRCPTKRMGAEQRQHMTPPPNGSSFWRYVFTAWICGPEFPQFFHKKCI